ncbi:MAG: hypothetical protein AAFV54_01350 [Pseudomonadota bacterium]
MAMVLISPARGATQWSTPQALRSRFWTSDDKRRRGRGTGICHLFLGESEALKRLCWRIEWLAVGIRSRRLLAITHELLLRVIPLPERGSSRVSPNQQRSTYVELPA